MWIDIYDGVENEIVVYELGLTNIEIPPPQSRTQSNACARARMALALGKLNFSCAVIGLTFINRACRQRTGTPKFRGSGCQFPQSQCHPSPRTGIALGTPPPPPQHPLLSPNFPLRRVHH
jgi:hypothetical protein